MVANLEKLEYVKLIDYGATAVLRFRYFDDFINQLDRSTPSKMYRCTNDNSDVFLFIDGGVIYSFNTFGYNNLNDIKKAIKLGFSGSASKYRVDNDGIYEVDSYSDKSREGQIYYKVIELGYKNFKEFEEAFSNGFEDAKTFRAAKESGFKDRRDFEDAKERGFLTSEEYKASSKIGIESKKTYDEYLALKKIKDEYGFNRFDETHVYVILNRKALGKKKTVKKIMDTLNGEEPEYEAEWYSRSFDDLRWGDSSEKLKKFLKSNKQVALLGSYDASAQTFENYSDTKILVDGSNVAWNNGSREAGDRPDAKNIALVLDALKHIGYSDINVLCDAFTEREILSPDIFKGLIKDKVLRIMPSKTDADAFIIEFAKKFHSRIITNDTFKDWSLKDRWVAENANQISIRFQIIDGEVVLHSALGDVKDDRFISKEFEFKGFSEAKGDRRWR